MVVYTMPAMPLDALVWYEADEAPPLGSADTIVACSLSPVQPADYFRASGLFNTAQPTHIIRCLADPEMGDSILAGSGGVLFPCTVYEVPAGSGHFYAAAWYHEVGAGFPNHHARVYVSRCWKEPLPGSPVFRGWI